MLRQINYFQAVVQLNSFSKAAEKCHISQSAISQQIQALEAELGFQLIERKNRKFLLTPAGEYFYQKSLILTADYNRICREAAKIAGGDKATLRIGYLRCYSGNEFHRAIEEFTGKYPDVSVQIKHGNHEELYDLLRTEKVDIVLNDQRRSFSDQYVNLILTTATTYIEISAHNELSELTHITPEDLKNTPCILIASQEQQETEREYYHSIVGFQSEFLYADNLEEARLLVIGNSGFLPIEGIGQNIHLGTSIIRIPLVRGKEPVTRNYCAFWKKNNSGYYVEEFAEMLKTQFTT